jgi:signal transduction histidine kinase
VVDGQVHRLDVRPPVADRVTAIESAESDSLWVASGSVVSRVELQPDGTWLRTALPLDLPEGRQLRSLLLDRRGSLWIGTNGYGLYRVNRLAARRFGAESGLGEITALAPDGGGGAFASSGCRGLFHVAASGHVTPIELRDPADAAGILGGECGISLGAGGGDRAWARSGSHLFLVRRRGLEVRRVPVILPDVEGPVAANPDGSVWVVSRTGVAHLVSLGGHVAREVPLPGPLMSASVGGDGSLWVGGDGAVFQVDRDGVRAFGPREHMPRGLVRDVVPEPDGTLWVGTYGGGVGRWRAGRFVRLTVEHGLPDNSVSRILDDGRGRMWISTNRGLAVVDRRNLHEVAEGRLRDLAPVVLGPERGVAEANFGSPAGFADTNGRLWFSTIDGVALVDAARFPFNATAPLVRIESVLADGRPLTVGEVVQVPRLTERVRVAFSAFELLYPERMRFRFRVEGVDADWVDVGPQRTADWTPPGPGEHRFLVEARNEDGVWSETPAAIVLDVIPAWWQTTAVRAAATLAAVVATVGAFGVRVRRIERRHAERLRVLEEQRNAERRVAELRAQLEHVARVALAGELAGSLAHEVSQPIGAMVNNAEAGRRHLTQYLQHPEQIGAIFDDIVADGMRASEVIRGLRGFLRPRRAAISRVDLSDLVREMLPLVRRELTEGHVRTELSLDDALPPIEGYRVQLGQVVVNLVMNACEALVEIAADRQIGVSTAVRDGRVELAVRDNGPGLAPEVAAHVFEPFVTTKPGGLGMGLAICRAIAEAHGGHLRAVPVPGGGLEVTLSLPAAPTEAFPP